VGEPRSLAAAPPLSVERECRHWSHSSLVRVRVRVWVGVGVRARVRVGVGVGAGVMVMVRARDWGMGLWLWLWLWSWLELPAPRRFGLHLERRELAPEIATLPELAVLGGGDTRPGRRAWLGAQGPV